MLGIRRRQNRFKRPRVPPKRHLAAALKMMAGAIGIALLSFVFIFCHDAVTQCEALGTKAITVTGNRHLSREEVCERAGIRPGANILAVNTVAARKRLLADPWIAEVQIRRDIPDKIHVAIREHHALAVVDLGRKFLLDDDGSIFKEVAPPEADNLPVVAGLRYADIDLRPAATDAGSAPAAASGRTPGDQGPVSLFAEALAVLRLGVPADSVIPNRDLVRLVVDGETGISLETRSGPKTVRLGFQDYAAKYGVLQRLFAHLAQRGPNGWRKMETVDLSNLERIVVEPLDEAAGDGAKTS
ncbi:MAG: FtsQ-type POTRA domain-containing protein [Desulfobacterales bacterium]